MGKGCGACENDVARQGKLTVPKTRRQVGNGGQVVGGRRISGLFCWLAAMLATSAFAGPIYTIAGFTTPDAVSSGASAISSTAQIAGTSVLPDGTTVAFVADASGTRQLDPLSGGHSSSASGINSAGAVAGTTYSDSGAQATLWTIAGAAGLGTLGGADSYATDVNSSGVVVGGSSTSSGATHAYSYNGTMRDLGTLAGGSWSAAYAVNSAGQVAGYGDTGAGSFSAFLWTTTGGMTRLGTLGGRSSYAMDINDNGAVAGNAQTSSGYLHAFLYDGGQTRDLGTLSGTCSFAYDVNNLGQVVGYSLLAGLDVTHAFLYSGGAMLDLNRLIAGDSGWILTEAYGINDAGQIAGTGYFGGEQRAFLLDPAGNGGGPALMMSTDAPLINNPEPGPLSLIALGAALLLLPRLIRRLRNGGRSC
jgi:probable HAF family extracellular repeat protein